MQIAGRLIYKAVVADAEGPESAGPLFWQSMLSVVSIFSRFGSLYFVQQTACLVVNPITVGNFAFLFNCTPVGRTSDSMMVPT